MIVFIVSKLDHRFYHITDSNTGLGGTDKRGSTQLKLSMDANREK